MALGPRSWTLLRETLTALLHADENLTAGKPPRPPSTPSLALPSLDPSTSPTTPTSTLRSITPHASANSSAPISRFCPTTSTFPSAIMAAPRPSFPVVYPSFAHLDRPAPPPQGHPLYPTNALDYELELALYIGQPNLLGSPFPSQRPPSTSSASAFSTTGPHAIFSPGSTNLWVLSWQKLRHYRLAMGHAYGRARTIPSAAPSRPPQIPNHFHTCTRSPIRSREA